MSALLEFDGVSKHFTNSSGTVKTAVENLSFATQPGEFLGIVGPSGCGKSTILNMVAGLDRPSEGSIRLDTLPVTAPSSRVAFMLQKDLLLPWRSIVRNVEFGLEAHAIAPAERRERALFELDRCRLTDVKDYYPHQLSGGMRQRAALARTLAVRPEVILFDEPFSSLDAQTKLLLQHSFAQMIAAAGVTTLLITHDLHEAVIMSDRILVMSDSPGRFVDEVIVELPDRHDTIARARDPKTAGYVGRLFDALHMNERVA